MEMLGSAGGPDLAGMQAGPGEGHFGHVQCLVAAALRSSGLPPVSEDSSHEAGAIWVRDIDCS